MRAGLQGLVEREGMGVLSITHERGMRGWCGRVVVLGDGGVVERGGGRGGKEGGGEVDGLVGWG